MQLKNCNWKVELIIMNHLHQIIKLIQQFNSNSTRKNWSNWNVIYAYKYDSLNFQVLTLEIC